jgi:ribosomal protein S18 acetylase RimI-like enzyme
MAFQIRSLREADISKMVGIINEVNADFYEFIPNDERNVRSWLETGKLKILVAEESGKVVGSAAYNDDHWGEEIEWLVVVSDVLNRRDLEDSLASKIERCVKGRMVFVSIDEGSPRIDDWVARGYKVEGGLYHMIATPEDLGPPLQFPEGVTYRRLKPDEENILVRTVNEGFGWERLKTGCIEEWKTENPPFDEEWVQVGEAKNEIVSVVVAKPDTNHNRFLNMNRGYLGPAVTLPKYRGKNIGAALTRQGTTFLFEKGFDSVALYTGEQNLSSLGLLRKVGFKIGHHWCFLRKNLS